MNKLRQIDENYISMLNQGSVYRPRTKLIKHLWKTPQSPSVQDYEGWPEQLACSSEYTNEKRRVVDQKKKTGRGGRVLAFENNPSA